MVATPFIAMLRHTCGDKLRLGLIQAKQIDSAYPKV